MPLIWHLPQVPCSHWMIFFCFPDQRTNSGLLKISNKSSISVYQKKYFFKFNNNSYFLLPQSIFSSLTYFPLPFSVLFPSFDDFIVMQMWSTLHSLSWNLPIRPYVYRGGNNKLYWFWTTQLCKNADGKFQYSH